jgi:hypothetical protein
VVSFQKSREAKDVEKLRPRLFADEIYDYIMLLYLDKF